MRFSLIKKILTPDIKHTIILLAITLISGLLYFYSTGFNEQWYLLWIAPIPILTYSLFHNKKSSFIVAFIAYFIGKLNLINYFGTDIPMLIIIPSIIIDSLIIGIFIVLNRYVVRKINYWIAIFFFPFLWTGYEFLLSLFSPGGSSNSLAYTQIKFLPLIQITSYTGIWGITFVILLFASGVSCIIYFRKQLLQSLITIIITAVVIILVMSYGLFRLHSADNQPSVRVGLASIKAPINVSGQKAIDLSYEYTILINKMAQNKAKFIVLPEKFLKLEPQTYDQIINIFNKTAKLNNIYIIIGVTQSGIKNYNSAIILGPDGKKMSIYNKMHMVPKLEAKYSTGNKIVVIDSPFQWGVAICKDMDFSSLGIIYGRKKVQLMLVPALDFNVDDWVHARIAIMRGVENGFSVVRAANQGLLTASNQFGQVIAIKETTIDNANSLVTNIQLGTSNTFYSKFRNWFGYLSIVFVISFLVYSFRPRKEIKP